MIWPCDQRDQSRPDWVLSTETIYGRVLAMTLQGQVATLAQLGQ